MKHKATSAEITESFRLHNLRKIWQAYLSPCCQGCRSGTADCDVNPLHKPPTQAECAVALTESGVCP